VKLLLDQEGNKSLENQHVAISETSDV